MNTSKQINIMILLVFAAVFATGAYTLWDPTRAEEAEEEQLEVTVHRGAYLFSQNCRVCHGDAGEGGAAANRLRAAPPLDREDLQGLDEEGNRSAVAYANDYKLVYNTITCGRVGKAMPAWAQAQGGTLNSEQIKQLTVFILEGSGWEDAKEFAVLGDPEHNLDGDNRNGLELAEPVAEDDTTITLNQTQIIDETTGEPSGPAVNANERLAIGDEIMLVQEVDIEANTVTVERGIGTTSPEAHEAGAIVLQPPSPPDPPAILETSCGQIAGAAAPTGTPEPPSAELSIVAEGIAWNKTTLSAIAATPLTITVDNRDEGTLHNWALSEGGEPGGEQIAATELESGPVTQTLDFGPLTAGEYYYICEVHPQMEGVLTAYAPGTGPEGAGAPAGGDATPAADTTAAPADGTGGDEANPDAASTPAADATAAP